MVQSKNLSFGKELKLHEGGQCIYPCFPGESATSPPQNIVRKSLSAFPDKDRRDNTLDKKMECAKYNIHTPENN